MSVRNLQHLFEPTSVAIIGASKKPHSVGATVLNNLIVGGFSGDIFPVNPKYSKLNGLPVFASVSTLPKVPELAIICTPPMIVPAIIRELGERGTKAVIVLTAGLSAPSTIQGQTLKQEMLSAAKPHLLRILGPNCVGLLLPKLGLNASFAHTGALPGKIAFVSQSGALVTGILDWAKTRGIGFSKFVSLGESADVDFGDVLDYLASDQDTKAILLYVEDIHSARKFMSAARSAARSKPVLVLKAGRAPEGAKAAASHTGALAGSDDVYDAAIRRAGMLRVMTTEELFDAVATLAGAQRIRGDRLVILTNGGGPGVMATDALIERQGHLAVLSAATIEKLNTILPPTWSHGNPVDIIGDAPADRYVQTLEILLEDNNSDAILFIHAPTAIVPSSDIASEVAPIVKSAGLDMLACWLGGDSVAQARRTFSDAGIPTYHTPEDAVSGFMQVVQYRRNQALLMEVPPSASGEVIPDGEKARSIVRQVLAEGRSMLSEVEAKNLLMAYGIPVVKTIAVNSLDNAVRAAEEIGFPVAIKVIAPTITHKSDVGGVALELNTSEAVRTAAELMIKNVQSHRPDAVLQGFSVQEMVARREDARELIVGVATDAVFGPVILFGHGGTAVEVINDHAIGLPPLNHVLARDLVSRTRVAKLLAGYRHCPAADIDAICRTLVQISNLIIDVPEITELDINPLLAHADGVIALDARIQVKAVDAKGADRLAIRPYPEGLEERIAWQGESILLRPIKPEDGLQHIAFFNALMPEDVQYRFFMRMSELRPEQLARLTQIDYDREIAFIAIREIAPGQTQTIGVVRAVADPDNISAEFAIIVRSDIKGRGLGAIMMKKLIDYYSDRGTKEIVGEALVDNKRLIDLVTKFGFSVRPIPDDHLNLKLHLDLTAMK